MITRRTLIAGSAAAAAAHAVPAHAAPAGDAEILARLLRFEYVLADAPHSAEHVERLEQTILKIGGLLPARPKSATELGVAPGDLEEALLGEWIAAIGELSDARWVQLAASIAGSHAQQLGAPTAPFIPPR